MRAMFWAATLAAMTWAGTATARPVTAYLRPGADLTATEAAERACWDQSRGVQTGAPAVTGTYAPNVYAAAGAGLAAGLMAGWERGKARSAFVDRCMRKQGFGEIELTPQEEGEFQAQTTEAGKRAWAEAFLKRDLGDRAAAALVPKVAAMPSAPPQPLTYGPLRFDAAQLQAASGPVAVGQPVLAGKAAHRRTARLTEDFQVAAFLDFRAEKGSVFHVVETRPEGASPGEEESSRWCGPVRNNSIMGRITNTNCIWSAFDGYKYTTIVGGPAWLVGSMAGGPAAAIAAAKTISLEESDEDLAGALDFRIELRRIAEQGVWLRATASDGGTQRVAVWEGIAPYDAAGRAVLPFWSHRLVLQPEGKTVTATFTADGDGGGWTARLR